MKDDHPPSAGADLHVIGWTPDPKGVVDIVTAAPASAPALDYAFEGGDGDIHPVSPKSRQRSPTGDVNLIDAADARAAWRLVDGTTGARLGVNLSELWTLPGAETAYLGSATKDENDTFEAAAQLRDPLTGGDTVVSPLTRYRFTLLTAAHRCAARVSATVLGEDGRPLETHVREIDPKFRGGHQTSAYDSVRLEFATPSTAAAVRLTLTKGRTTSREDSFVFFVLPELRELRDGAGGEGEAVRLSKAGLKSLRSQGGVELERATLAPPSELFRGDRFIGDIVVLGAGASARVGPVTIERAPEATVEVFIFDRARIRVRGKVAEERETLELGVYVDGEPSAAGAANLREGRFEAEFMLASEHMDGRPHAIELRLLPEQAPLARMFEILPARLTPWETIQQVSRAPTDILASPTAAHHYRAYRAWAKAAREGVDPPADLAMLHDRLLQGFEKRATYVPLAFPDPEAPDVTVVVPAHNKFEVTYHCLVGLLFAHNRASFEVVLVDDGSSDETREAERFLSGVRVVRHEKALGFVDACNAGAALARGRYVAFLNNDTEPTAGWLDELIRTFIEFDGVGLAGSKLVYGDGRLQEAGGLIWRTGNPSLVGRKGNAEDPRYNYLRQTDYVSGAAVLLPLELWREVGGFSPEFAPGYFEDTDLAMKVRAAGKRVVYVPTSTVIHFEGQSAGVDLTSGMKRFQEVNRPKFKRKWGTALLGHGAEKQNPDREKDRGVAFRVLFIDQRIPQLDSDAGSYAAFQEIRLLQACGAKVTFLPRNLAWMDRHTLALQRIGVECLHAPFVLDFQAYVASHAGDYDVIYVNRYRIAEQLLGAIREAAPRAKVVLNLADLHFLRELREAEAKSPGYSFEGARRTRTAELAVIRGVDLTLSYTDVETAVIQSHVDGEARVGRLPWVVDVDDRPRPAFAETEGLLFLGGFGHPPNVQAVRYYAAEIWPLLRKALPEAVLDVVGSQPPPDLQALSGAHLRILGQVPDLRPAFDRARLFIAPLLAGAGIKGKVLEAMARGSAMVLSPIAAEGTGLVDGTDCLIADTPEAWSAAIHRLYTNEELWSRLGEAARHAAQVRFGFDAGRRRMEEVLMKVDVFTAPGLHYKRARPDDYPG